MSAELPHTDANAKSKPSKFIAGDWGTSNLRLYLCEYRVSGSTILDTRFGAGISEINNDFEDRFFNLTQDWFDSNADLPVLLSGMVGSTIGWKEAPYLNCPVSAQQIAEGRISFRARGVNFSILAGLRAINPLGAPDVMRGEELQLLGWMRAQSDSDGRTLFALPGTHNKWAISENGEVSNFLTAFTGELFALLRNHSILISEQSSFSFNEAAFNEGLRAIQGMGPAQLVHLLFTTRAKQVLGEITAADGSSYLSGLIIGADVKGALSLFTDYQSITIIGEPTLTEHYKLALRHFGQQAQSCDPASIAIAGFESIYQEIFHSSFHLH